MTREEFINLTKEFKLIYREKGDKLIITGRDVPHGGEDLYLLLLDEIPPGLVFMNGGIIYLNSLTQIPPGTLFKNGGNLWLDSLLKIPQGVRFENKGTIFAKSVIDISPGVKFKNSENVFLDSIKKIPRGVEFDIGGDVGLYSLAGDFEEWEGNIKGIPYINMLNLVVSEGLFE